ncbi:hypothetical protein BN439_2915 [Erwinia amylovora Ea644]|nr:hypothetical protein BN439_2915 [Erwinia amylovora Ea644]
MTQYFAAFHSELIDSLLLTHNLIKKLKQIAQ